MVISISACGESGFDWGKTPCDYSIGVNDFFKFGYPANELLLVNSPKSFTPDRLETIKSTKFDKVLTHSGTWDKIFPQNERIRMQSFSKHLEKGHVYSSKTSPFVAMSLAFNLGATDIILHGVDLIDHPAIKDKLLNYEIRNIQSFTKLLKDQGCNVWLSKPIGALKYIIPHWNSVLGKMRKRISSNNQELICNGLYTVKGDELS